MKKWTIKIETDNQMQIVTWLEMLKNGFEMAAKVEYPLDYMSFEYGDETLECKLESREEDK